MSIINQLRYEYKYLLHSQEYHQMKNLIKKLMKIDVNSGLEDGYYVRSLYFDDMYDTALAEKRLGNLNRVKYRIRIYDYSDQIIKLEIKEKFSDFISKKSYPISWDEYEKIWDGDIAFLHKSDNQMKEAFYYQFRNNLLKPKVIVDYFREAYMLPYHQIRITFDKNLAAGKPQKNMLNRELYTELVGEEYAYIMEVKYNHFLPNAIRSILETRDLTRLAVSKYVISREYMNKRGV